jgi:hypothetical protein
MTLLCHQFTNAGYNVIAYGKLTIIFFKIKKSVMNMRLNPYSTLVK